MHLRGNSFFFSIFENLCTFSVVCFQFLKKNYYLSNTLFYKLEAFLARLSNLEAMNGFGLNFVLFPVAIFAKNSPVTGPSLNPEPLEKN